MGQLLIPVKAIMLSGMHHNLYIAERLKAAGAPITIEKNIIHRTGPITQEEDPNKKCLIFHWEDKR